MHRYKAHLDQHHTINPNRPGEIILSGSATEAWKVISSSLPSLDKDAAFWWRETGSSLGLLLLEAGYDLHGQYEGLLFYYRFIVCGLGPRPTLQGQPKFWKSFMTDDFSPIEYSWKWGHGTASPEIRYSIEAIGPSAGTAGDAFNQAMTMELVRKIQPAFPEADWQWFHQLSKQFYVSSTTDDAGKDLEKSQSHQSSFFMAFELRRGGVDIKAYFIPINYLRTERPLFKHFFHVLKSLEQPHLKFPALEILADFMTTHPTGSLLKAFCVAVDCVKPSMSRLKIYARSLQTSFDTVRTIMAIGDPHVSLQLEDGLRELRLLWNLVLGLDDEFPSAQELPLKEHQTSGILFNFDVRAGIARPEAKIYIPVRHYGRNDQAVAQGLESYLISRGHGGFVQNYMRMLQGLCTHRTLDSSPGLQTYISCSIKNGSLSITSYLGPEIYHEARRSNHYAR